MKIGDDELLEVLKEGGKVISRTGAKGAAPTLERPSEAGQVVNELRKLTAVMNALLAKESPAPVINIEGADVSVSPKINIQTARAVEAEVTERDSERRIKKVRFTPIE